MAYFSNGTEGEYYREEYCDNCIHDVNNDCPIWLIHLLHNGDKTFEGILNYFIPRSNDGLSNKQCEMFIPTEKVTHD